MGDSKLPTDISQFEWLQLNREMHAAGSAETTREKFRRKVTESPLVPLGCLTTLGALCYGLWSFRTGQRKMSQYMMRARIFAQAFTIVAVLAGLGMSVKKNKE